MNQIVAAGSGAVANGRRIKEQPDTHDTETHRENPSDVHMAKFILIQRECAVGPSGPVEPIAPASTADKCVIAFVSSAGYGRGMSRLRRHIPLLIVLGVLKALVIGWIQGLKQNRFLHKKNHIACAAGEMRTISPTAQA